MFKKEDTLRNGSEAREVCTVRFIECLFLLW